MYIDYKKINIISSIIADNINTTHRDIIWLVIDCLNEIIDNDGISYNEKINIGREILTKSTEVGLHSKNRYDKFLNEVRKILIKNYNMKTTSLEDKHNNMKIHADENNRVKLTDVIESIEYRIKKHYEYIEREKTLISENTDSHIVVKNALERIEERKNKIIELKEFMENSL